MAYRLKSPVSVSTGNGSEIVVLEAGTPLADIPDDQKAQLAPDHFRDENDKTPKDWRPAARQAKDRAQARFLEEHVKSHTRSKG